MLNTAWNIIWCPQRRQRANERALFQASMQKRCWSRIVSSRALKGFRYTLCIHSAVAYHRICDPQWSTSVFKPETNSLQVSNALFSSALSVCVNLNMRVANTLSARQPSLEFLLKFPNLHPFEWNNKDKYTQKLQCLTFSLPQNLCCWCDSFQMFCREVKPTINMHFLELRL